jgi:HlyD family secretion protein
MSFQSSSVPAPKPGGEPQPKPGPIAVPPQQPGRRRRALWGISLLVLAGLGAAYWLNAGKTGGGGPVVSISTAVVTDGAVNATIRVNGTIAARDRWNILAPRIQGSRSDVNRGGMGGGNAGGGGGRGSGGGASQIGFGGGGPSGDFSLILMKLAAPGSRVKKGDVVAQFDPQMQNQRLDDYKDSLIQLEAQIKAQMASLQSARESHSQQVRSGKANWDTALQEIKKKEVSAAIDQEKQELSVTEAEEQYKQLEYEDALVDEQQRVQIHQRELNREQARLELQRTVANVDKMTIKSQMDGIVVMASTVRNGEMGLVREGDEVRAGQPFMYIVNPSSMVLEASVNQVDAEKLRLGMKAKIRLDAYSDIEVPATLEGIGAMSTTSTFRAGYVGQIPIRLRLDKMDPRIIPDLTASAEISLSTEENTVVAPRGAVFEENGSHFVFVQGPQGWIRKPVETGLGSYTQVAIRSGLRKGEVVALQRP